MPVNLELILRDRCRLVKNRRTVVGVSGGPDSLCLMKVLHQAGYPMLIAHFNHHLRPEAEKEAQAVQEIALRLNLEAVVGGAQVHSHARREGLSIEEAARELRYAFMFNLARERDAQAVAVGHTADDQVETVLMHCVRGSGLAGLTGMQHRSIVRTLDPAIPIVRPLLDVWRHDTLAYCAAHDLTPCFDASNEMLDFQRNRIRHVLIPSLEAYNPKIREALLRMSQVLNGDHELILEIVNDAWSHSVAGEQEDCIVFDSPRLSSYSPGLQRNLVKRAAQFLRPSLDIGFAAIERACAFINDPYPPPHVELAAGLRILREMDRIYICTPEAGFSHALWPQLKTREPLPVSIPGLFNLAGEWKLAIGREPVTASTWGQVQKNQDPFQVWLDMQTLSGPVEIRPRRPGDRFEPLGLNDHSQKLSDFMVNQKMPRRAREFWPLVCSGDRIIWVPGYRPAHKYRLTKSTVEVVHFSVFRVSGRRAE